MFVQPRYIDTKQQPVVYYKRLFAPTLVNKRALQDLWQINIGDGTGALICIK